MDELDLGVRGIVTFTRTLSFQGFVQVLLLAGNELLTQFTADAVGLPVFAGFIIRVVLESLAFSYRRTICEIQKVAKAKEEKKL